MADLRLVEENRAPYRGIKGPSCFSNLIQGPFLEKIALDPMHASFLGWCKHFSNLIFHSGPQNPYYIGIFNKFTWFICQLS